MQAQSLKTYVQTAQAELDRLSRQCLTIKNESSGGLLAIEQRLQALRNELDKRGKDVEKLRRENQAALIQHFEVIVNCKSCVSARSDPALTAHPLQTKVTWSIRSRKSGQKWNSTGCQPMQSSRSVVATHNLRLDFALQVWCWAPRITHPLLPHSAPFSPYYLEHRHWTQASCMKRLLNGHWAFQKSWIIWHLICSLLSKTDHSLRRNSEIVAFSPREFARLGSWSSIDLCY